MAIPIKAVLSVSTKAFTKGFGVATKALGGFVALAKTATIAIVGLTAAFSALILRQTAVIDRIGKVSKVTGVAAETLQKFSFAAELAGVSSDQAQVALRRFSRRLGEAQKGTGELLPALRRLGINTKDASGRFKTAEEVLFELADGIANTEGASAKLAIAFKAFDSEGAELVNTLSKGGDALREVFDEATRLGFVLNTSAIQGVEDFNDEMNKLQALVGGVANQFTSALAPVLEQVVKDLTKFITTLAEEQGGFESLGQYLKNEFINIVITIIEVFETLTNIIIRAINEVTGFARAIGLLDDIELSKEMQESLDAVKAMKGELNFINKFDFRSTKIFDQLDKAGVDTKAFRDELERLQNLPLWDQLNPWGEYTKGSAQLFEDVSNLVDALEKGLLTDAGIDIKDVDVSELIEYLRNLRDIVPESVEYVKDFKVATIETNRELDLTLGYWERIILQIGDFFTRDLPAKIKDSIEQIKSIFKTVGERLMEMTDPVKTLEDGLVKAGRAFEDALVDAIMTGKANFEDFRNLLRETLARAMVQKFITGPIFGLFGLAKGGPAKAGTPYIVGEEGPELFVPGTSGTVIPNKQTMSMGAGAGAGPTVINISAVDTQSFQQALARDPEFIYNVTRAGARRTPGG